MLFEISGPEGFKFTINVIYIHNTLDLFILNGRPPSFAVGYVNKNIYCLKFAEFQVSKIIVLHLDMFLINLTLTEIFGGGGGDINKSFYELIIKVTITYL